MAGFFFWKVARIYIYLFGCIFGSVHTGFIFSSCSLILRMNGHLLFYREVHHIASILII